MGLILTIEHTGHGEAPDAERRVDGGRLTIGRAPNNDWVLADPERFLSKQHCLIEQQGSGWSITDTSSNGVYIGPSQEALGRGRSVALDNGTVFRIGDYTIRASLDDGQATGINKGLLDDPFDPFGAPSAPKRDSNDSMLDQSWISRKTMRAAEHPVARPVEGPATPHDHISPEHQSLELPSPKKTAVSLFDDNQTDQGQPAPPATSTVPEADPFFDPNAAEEPAPETPAPATKPAPEPPDRPGGVGQEALVHAFLEGAGIDPRQVPVEDPEVFFRENGTLFRELVFGLSQLLANRAMLKREIGVDQTMIGAAGNNPLKMSASPEEAVMSLLTYRGAGYLDPLPAVYSAFDDVKSHEIAMLDATQAALNTVLRRFEPAALERELSGTSALTTLFSGGRKALTWEMFKERYNEIAKNARERFLGDVGVDFAKAYKQTMEKM